MAFLIFEYIVTFIVLIVIQAPWWAWLIYIGGALIWLAIWAFGNSESNEKAEEPQKTHQ